MDTREIQQAQIEAAEDLVVAELRRKGLLPPDPAVERTRLEREVVEAARKWHADRIHIVCTTYSLEQKISMQSDANQPLAQAVDALEKFEAENKTNGS